MTSLASSLATEHVVQHLWKYYCVNVLLEYIFIVDLSLDVLLECLAMQQFIIKYLKVAFHI